MEIGDSSKYGPQNLIAKIEGVNYRLEDPENDIPDHVWKNKQLQLIKECKIPMVLEQVCVRLESLLPNHNDFVSKNEFGNAIRVLGRRIDIYRSRRMSQNLRFVDVELHDPLLSIQLECHAIVNRIYDVTDAEKLSADGIAEFKAVAFDFLMQSRQFHAKLVEEFRGEQRTIMRIVHEKFQRFNEFMANKKWWIPAGVLSGACAGAAAGAVLGGPPGAAVGAAVGAFSGSVIGATARYRGALKYEATSMQ